MRTLLTFFVLLPFLSFAQVGVNTTTPNAALDIQSTSNGVLIPRVQLTNALDIVTVVNPAGGLLAKSTLVYNIGSSGIAPDNVIDGFYYWNGVRWIPIAGNSTSDHDWYEEGTTTAPDAITDDMFHMGKVAIGKNTANANLDIFSSTLDASIVNELNNPDNNDQTTIFNTISGLGTSPHIGVWNWLFGKGNIVGSINQLNSSSDGTGFIRGVETSISGSGNTEQSGVWTLLESDGDNIHTGIYSSLGGAGNGRHIGSDNLLYSSGTGTKYGTRNIIADAAGGQHFGVYSEVLKPGSNFAGYFRGKVAIGTNATIGIDDYIFPSSRGTNGQIMQTDGAGNVTWQNASFDHDWYEEGTTTPPNDITDDMFHMGNMAIGKNTADYPLEVNTTNFQFGMYNTLNNTTTTSQQKATIKNDVFDNTNDPKYGVINTVTNNSATSGGIGVRNNIGGDGTTFFGNSNYLAAGSASNGADIIGIRNDLATDSNNASIKGAYNIFSGTSGNLNFMYGNLNDFRASANRKFGTFNIFNANTDGYNIGLYNSLLSDLAANDQYGVWNNFNTGSLTNGDNYGLYNLFSGDGISSKIGNYTRIDSNGDGQHIGAMQLINGSTTGLGTKYGTLTIINNTAGGTHYGIHSTVLKPGANNFAGYFLGNVGVGTTALNTYTFPPSRGTNGQIMQTDGSGNISWQNANSIAWSVNGNTAITSPAVPLNYGTSTIAATENFIGTKDNADVTFATDNIERMRIKNATGNVGIGIANPSATLEINSGGTTELKLSSRGAFGSTRFSMISDKELPDEWRPTYIQSADNGSFTGRMDFFTNGTGIANKFGSLRAMSITNGNVGIGTVNPTKKLDIVAPNNEIGLQILSGNNSELSYLSLGRTIEYAQIGACITSRFFLDALDGDMAIKNFGAGKILLGASVNTNADMSIIPGGNVGIGTVTPTSKLHIVNTTSGALRIVDGTQANGNVLRSDANGVGTWQDPSAFSWSLTGNTVNAATNFLGSTNDADVIFRRNNTIAGRLGQYRTSLGFQALEYYTNSFLDNTAIGNGALRGNSTVALNSGQNNTAVGIEALYLNSSGNDNTAIGHNTLQYNNANSNNTAIGSSAMKYSDSTTTGVAANNTAVGSSALRGSTTPANNTGLYNTAVGANAMLNITSGNSNTAIGNGALFDNSSGTYNVAIGNAAMQKNVGNSRSTAIGYFAMLFSDNRTVGRDTFNTAVGAFALRGGNFENLNTGQYNSAIGDAVMFLNTSGSYNTGTGSSALYSNTTGSNNTGIGSYSLYSNSTGNNNTAIGFNAGLSITTAVQNVAIGNNALDSNMTSGGNTAVGYDALQTTTGDFNTAFGNSALFSLGVGTSNCAFGYDALTGLTSGVNNIGIGTSAVVPNSTGSNQMRLGNTAITYAGVQVAWTITSDSRWKDKIKPSNLGLDFITKLNPVSYIRKNDESKKTEYGFIAQELEKTLIEFGATDNGIITKDDAGMLSVRYNDLLSPIVKAIQELKTENDTLKKQNESLEARLKKIEEKLNN